MRYSITIYETQYNRLRVKAIITLHTTQLNKAHHRMNDISDCNAAYSEEKDLKGWNQSRSSLETLNSACRSILWGACPQPTIGERYSLPRLLRAWQS
jgi:hypothetical protein